MNRLTEINDYGSFFKYCNAAIVVVSEDTKYYLEDGSAAIENMLLAARAHNIGSCWVAGDKKPYCRDIMDEFGVPEGYKLVGQVALGYSDNIDKEIRKKPLPELLHWENF